jgi:hypothetical protein
MGLQSFESFKINFTYAAVLLDFEADPVGD